MTYRIRLNGTGNLARLPSPVIFAANHNFHFDAAVAVKAMPLKLRRRLAVAAAADLWTRTLWPYINTLVGNGFPFSRDGAVRPSLENVGRILDKGWSVFIFPEGKLTLGAEIQPFKGGTGLLAVEGGVPVVPVRIRVLERGRPWKFPVLRRGTVEVTYGKPLIFARSTPYSDAARQIEEAVHAL
jgi:long-chain acyl-CoA synthetase